MNEAVIVALITAGIPAFVNLFTTKSVKKQANKHACRQSILQLIVEDKVAVMEGKLPENKQAILDEYYEYKSNGGNHYIDEKVEEYQKWYKSIEKGGKNGSSKRRSNTSVNSDNK